MLISQAFAGHFTPDTGNSGGGNTLLIILGAGILLGILYSVQKRLRRRLAQRQAENDSQDG
jgi:hypothetical protein